MPEGGGYPVGYVELVAKLIGCRDLARIVHVCSGSIRGPLTFDMRPASSASCLGDARRLPIRSSSVAWVMIDPPYGQDYADVLWGLGKQYPTPAVLLREAARILQPGGVVALLHHVVPAMPPELVRTGTYGLSTGSGYRMRALTIATRTGEAQLFD